MTKHLFSGRLACPRRGRWVRPIHWEPDEWPVSRLTRVSAMTFPVARLCRSALRLAGCAALSAVVLAISPGASAEPEPVHELVFFLSAEGFSNWNVEGDMIDSSDVIASADVLYSYSSESFRLLGEYLLSSEEAEIERLMAGWRVSEGTMLWLGRIHQPSKYWTTEYHHGQYMQTSITRPGIEEWEDDGGPITSHVTGVLLETDVRREDGSGLQAMVSLGLAPRFEDEELHPYDLFDPDSGHKFAANFRLAYWPDSFGDSQFGILGGFNDIDVAGDSRPGLLGVTGVEQWTMGLFADLRWGDWRLISTAIHFDHNIESGAADVTDKFQSGYLQLEYAVHPDWTLYGRSEFSANEDDSLFLDYLPDFIAHRALGGVRWDFMDKHALTLELAMAQRQGEDFNHEDFNQIRLQWSSAIP